jgi:hypothetical protein
MKVFISWSGQRSAAVADALRYWLPKVIQALEPWMSADDVEKGTRWRSGIATELEQSSVGIICLTRENLDSTWIHFEAGALSKQQQNTYVCTLLFDLEPTDVREPLAQFQATRARKDDVRKLISTINNTLGDEKLPESELSEIFEVWWPKLEERLANIGELTTSAAPIRADRELLEEILEIVRSQGGRITQPWIGSGVKSRLLSTLDWTPEDAELLFDLYLRILESRPSEEERNYAEELRTHEPTALEGLRNIKAAKEVRKKRKTSWGQKLADYLDPENKGDPHDNPNS